MSKIKKRTIILLSIIIVFIMAYVFSWYLFYNSKVKPIVEIADKNNYETEVSGNTTGRFDSFSREGIYGSVSIGIPGFGKYSGNVSILQGTMIDEDDNILNNYAVDLTVFIKVKNKYFVTLYESAINENSMGISSIAIDRFEVDKDMNLIDDGSHNEDTLELFKEQKSVILNLKNELTERFGEENLFE